ncbi:MAG: zf-HC2 domain-containing protein [Actinobacteria bacterium]|nr:zf-HC2 domain-containing protein [Actinomycetota bacterium]
MTDRHPEELLAPYVDGDLAREDRRAVDAHLAGCETCAGEVALARRATVSLRRLGEVPAPLGLATPAIQASRRESPWVRRIGWAAAGTAAAAIIALFVVSQSAGGGLLGDRDAAPAGIEAGPGDAPAPRATGVNNLLIESGKNYSREDLDTLLQQRSSQYDSTDAGAVAAEAGSDENSARVAAAIHCVERAGLRGDEGARLIQIEAARFEGDPAYIVLFTLPERRTDLWVIDRESCQIRYVAYGR